MHILGQILGHVVARLNISVPVLFDDAGRPVLETESSPREGPVLLGFGTFRAYIELRAALENFDLIAALGPREALHAMDIQGADRWRDDSSAARARTRSRRGERRRA